MKIAVAILICLTVLFLLFSAYTDGYIAGLEAAREIIEKVLNDEEGDTEED